MDSATTTGRIPDVPWLTPRRFGLLLGFLVFISFPRVFLGLETFVQRDFGQFSYPLAHYFRESFWRGEIPLWNPLNHCGLPFLAQWNTQVLYPPALFYLVFPLSWSLGVFCLLHLWLAGMGMFVLAERWAGNRFAAAVAGIVFAFSGLMLNSVVWPATIPGLAWMPWVVLLVERAWREGGKVSVVAALAGALQMLSGAVEVIMMTWAFLAVLASGEILSGFGCRLPAIGHQEKAIANSQWPVANRRIVLRLGIIVLLIAGLCAAQLLPFLDFLKHSNRQQGFDAARWAMPVTGLANFLAPFFRCENPAPAVLAQKGQYWTTSYYVGVFTIALGLMTLVRLRSRRVWLFGALVIVCLVLAVGDATPVYRLVTRIPGLNAMRFPVKFVILPMFLLPVLAAFAIAQMKSNAARTTDKMFFVIAVLLLAVMGFVVWRGSAVRHPWENWTALWQNTAVRALLFVGASIAFAFAMKALKPRLRLVASFSVLALVWLDLFTHIPAAQTVRPLVYSQKLPRETSPPEPGKSRAMITKEARRQLGTSGYVDPEEDYLRRRLALFANCNLLEDIPKVDGFFPMQTREHAEIFPLLFTGTNAPAAGLLDFIGVSMMTSPTNIFVWEPRSNFLPMLAGGQKPVFAEENETLRQLARTDFDPRNEVYLPVQAREEISVTNSAPVQIRVEKASAKRIEAEVEASAPVLLTVAQTFYPAWKAFVDDKPARIWKANHAFQAIEVPAGKHGIKFVYSDRAFRAGAMISCLSLGLVAVLLLRRVKAS